ncbi:unnamed protein product, partial [Rotaria sp. Silwood2]
CVQQNPDDVRVAFVLLQHTLSVDVINTFTPSSYELYLCQQATDKAPFRMPSTMK